MPIGPYKNFAECLADQHGKGHNSESAHKICGYIEHQVKKARKSKSKGKKK